MKFLLVALGSGIGGMTRYGVSLLANAWWGTSFPYGTLVVNLLGSFLIALVGGVASIQTELLSENASVFLIAGVFGGLTTYSSFNEQSLMLLREHGIAPMAINVGVTLTGCFGMGLLGLWIGRTIAT